MEIPIAQNVQIGLAKYKIFRVGNRLYESINGMPVFRPGNFVIKENGKDVIFRSYSGGARGEGAIDMQEKPSETSGIASGKRSVLIGGDYNTASGDYSAIVGGLQNEARGDYSIALGYGAVSSGYGQISHSNGYMTSPGDMQASEVIWHGKTTDGNTTELFLDGVSQRYSTKTNSIITIEMSSVASSDTEYYAKWEKYLGSSASSLGIVVTGDEVEMKSSEHSWESSIGSQGLFVTCWVSGQAGVEINWLVKGRILEIPKVS